MRRGWKLFWIISGTIAGAGLIMCVIAVGLGATVTQASDVFGTERYVSDHFTDWEMENEGSDFNLTEGANYVTGSSEFVSEFPGISGLDVELPYAEVQVITHKQDSVVVDTSNLNKRLRDKIEYTNEDGTLQIESSKIRYWKSLNHIKAGYVVILIPEDAKFAEVSFDLGAGLLGVDDINAESLDVNIGAGEAKIKQFEAGELDATCGAGQLTMNGNVTNEASLKCGVGDVNIQLDNKWEEFDYEVKCGIGEVKVGPQEYTGLVGNKFIQNGTGRLMELDCGVGAIEVAFNGK